MPINRLTQVSIALLMFLGSNLAAAAMIYDNGPPNFENIGANFSEGTNRVAADASFGSAVTVRGIEFWGGYWPSGERPPTDLFTLDIYANAGGSPGALLQTTNLTVSSITDTGFDHNGLLGANILDFEMNLQTPISLSAGTYWVSVVAAPGLDSTNFFWQDTGLDGVTIGFTNRQSQNFGATWPSAINEQAFNLTNTAFQVVLEPTSLALLGLALAGLGFSRRKSIANN